ncbi:MAG TPA: hypothetical protein VM012_09710 [Flavitalea sp.]|nr:hypothetical protein [Flavitalea sp.]
MNTEINQIVQQLFHRDNLEQLSEEDLLQFVDAYPYVTAGHLLLVKKQNGTASASKDHLKTASLYVNQPLWLQWLLDESKFTSQKELEILPFHLKAQDQDEESVAEKPAEEEPVVVAGGENSFVKESQSDDPSDVSQQEFISEDPDDTEQIAPQSSDAGTSNEPVFQSYHTIDYFASQGIKLQLADLEKDKLGQQLRSFTDWLRSMKRLHQTSPAGDEDPAEQTVRIIAEHSIEEREVLTEAMAEVWAKQGNRQKASDIYRKLSLLNPAKSSYFAAKIDQL